MKRYEVIKEEFKPCSGTNLPDHSEITELRIENPAMYVQEQYKQERSIEFLVTEHDGSTIIEALLEGGIKYRYTFSELQDKI